jgi:hypothetical protein
MTDNKHSWLPPEEAGRLAAAFISQMEETKPELWISFLYEQGLHSVLAKFLDDSPFGELSPTSSAIRKKVGELYPELSARQVGLVFGAIQLQTTDELISKHLDFRPQANVDQ